MEEERGWKFFKTMGRGARGRGGGQGQAAENKGMEKNTEWGGCGPEQNDGMYLFQLHDSKEF